jgi:hypothetical protein
MSVYFAGLKELLEFAPAGGTICGYTKNALSYRWDENEGRWVDTHVEPTHYVKYPGEDWKEVRKERA